MKKFLFLFVFVFAFCSFSYSQLYRVKNSKSIEVNAFASPNGFKVGSGFVYSISNSIRLNSGLSFDKVNVGFTNGGKFLGYSSLSINLYRLDEKLFFDASLGLQFGIENINSDVFNTQTSFVISEGLGLNVEYLLSRRFTASLRFHQNIWQFSKVHEFNFYGGLAFAYIFDL